MPPVRAHSALCSLLPAPILEAEWLLLMVLTLALLVLLLSWCKGVASEGFALKGFGCACVSALVER